MLDNNFRPLTEHILTMSEKAPLRVVITGAAGQIAYSLIYQVASGYVFGPDQVGLALQSWGRNKEQSCLSTRNISSPWPCICWTLLP